VAAETALTERSAALESREREIEERFAEREAALDASHRDIDGRERDLEVREASLRSESDRLAREQSDWEDVMRGAFSRLNELETDLASSLSLAGMLKRELEGRDGNASRDDRNGDEAGVEPERGGWYRGADARDEDPKASENDWWARQLGRRKKD
jgi:hypothetical protein